MIFRKWCVYTIYEKGIQARDRNHLAARANSAFRFTPSINKIRSKYPKVSRIQRLYLGLSTLLSGIAVGIHTLCTLFLLLPRSLKPHRTTPVAYSGVDPSSMCMFCAQSDPSLISMWVLTSTLTGLISHLRDKKYVPRKHSDKKS